MKKTLALALCFALLSTVLTPINLFSVSSEISVKAPTAWYRFDNGTALGTDATGNGNDLTAFGTPVADAAGKTNGAIKFDGTSSLYATPDGAGLDFADKIDTTNGGSGKISIAYWAKTSAADFANMGWRRIVDNGQNEGLGFGGFTMLNLIDSTSAPTLYNPPVCLSSASQSYVAYGNWSTFAYTTDWYYITWTLDTTTGQSIFYVNGTPIFDSGNMWVDIDFLLSNQNALFSLGAQTISQSFDNNMRLIDPFTGMIDELSVYDAILTPEEITYYMTRGYEAETSGYNVYLAPEMGCTAEYSLEGDTVTILATANEGYAINTMYYITDGGQTVQITGNTFEMPADNVTVYITAEDLTTASIVTTFGALAGFAQYHQGKMVLTGDSTMALWNTSDADLDPLNTVNLGVDDTSLNWQLANINVYGQYDPSGIVVYAGSEDMNGSELRSKTGEDTASLAIEYLTALKAELDVPIYYVSILPSRDDARWNVWGKIQIANSLIKAFCDDTDRIDYIDVASAILAEGTETGGKPLALLYAADGIQLSAAGYDVWATVIRTAVGAVGELPQNPPVNESLDQTPDLKAMLLGYYEFEDTSNPGKDSSYNGNDLTMYNQVFEDGQNWWEPSNAGFAQTDGAEGQGKAISLDGYNFLVYETPEGEQDFVDGAKSLTVSYYVKNRTLVFEETAYANGWMVAVNNGGNYPEQKAGWSLNCAYNNEDISNNFPMWIEDGTNSVVNTINAGMDRAKEWNRITYVLDSDAKSASVYLNGVLRATTPIAGELTLNNPLFDFSIGAFAVGDPGEYSTYIANAPFVGYLDSVMVFDGALTARQVADLESTSFDALTVTSSSEDVIVDDIKITYKSNVVQTYAQLLALLTLSGDGSIKLVDNSGAEITDYAQNIAEGSALVIYNDRNIIVNQYALALYSEVEPTPEPTVEPTVEPTAEPTAVPTGSPQTGDGNGTTVMWIMLLMLLSAAAVTFFGFAKRREE